MNTSKSNVIDRPLLYLYKGSTLNRELQSVLEVLLSNRAARNIELSTPLLLF